MRFDSGARGRMEAVLDVPKLDILAVHVIYAMSRVFDHNSGYTTAVRGELEKSGMTLPNAIALARI